MHGEQARLGFQVSEATVRRILRPDSETRLLIKHLKSGTAMVL
jgi:hypothetical protein